jgi:hypothetical protein
MTKLHELLQQKPTNGSFGIEIETEGKNLTDAVPAQWKIENDGSLRGRFPDEAVEYVLRKPLELQKAIDAVTQLRKAQDDANARLNFSFRTSVHVHVNVQQLTFNQYLNMIYTYLLLEEPLVRYCGKERVGNRFCLRLQDAEGLIDYLFMLFRQGHTALRHIHGDAVRYASINVAATSKYGSLEFRSLKGNMDVGYITTWLQALDNLRSFAQEHANPQVIHDLFVNSTPEQFAEIVLGDVYPAFVYPEMDMDMRSSFSLTLELPYNFTDNSDIEEMVLKDRKDRAERQKLEIAEMMRQQDEDRAIRRAKPDNRRIPPPHPDQIVPKPAGIDWEAAVQAAQVARREHQEAVRQAGEDMARRAIGRRGANPVRVIYDDIMIDDVINAPLAAVERNQGEW